MIPTLLPVVVTLGAMGWMGMGLDVGRAMIAAVLIGIAVDDSVHVLSQYKKRRVAGDDPGAAIRGAILHSGRAVVTTSLALSLGFLTLMASAWQTISSFGFFVALAILGALAAALFVLPALIFAFERGGAGGVEAPLRRPSGSNGFGRFRTG
jgi:predicted RND superfamily exporter protein